MKHFIALFFCLFLVSTSFSQVIYINPELGIDANSGSDQEPLKTLKEAIKRVNAYSGEHDSLVVKLQPGLYNLDENLTINFNNNFTEQNTLTIEAAILPDDANWKPEKMPVLISTAAPIQTDEPCTFSLRIETDYVTVRGIKFLSNPDITSKHFCIYRLGDTRTNLKVSQCMFLGNRDIMPIQVAVMVNGHGVEVDHCIFSNCRWAAIFYYGKDETGYTTVKNSAMHHCIITDADKGAIWAAYVDPGFKFYNNIVNNCKYFWARTDNTDAAFTLENSIIANAEIYSARYKTNDLYPENYGFVENNVQKDTTIELVKWDEKKPFEVNNRFLHVAVDGIGAELGAGIFLEDLTTSMSFQSQKKSPLY